MSDDEYSVAQFYPDGSYEYVARWIGAREAVETFKHICEKPAAAIGTIRRVIVTDGGDCTNMEWKFGQGYTYPPALLKYNRSKPKC